MAVPTLKLDLAPPSNLWRMNHTVIGWTALAIGAVLLAASLGFTWKAYAAAAAAGRKTVSLVAQTSRSADAQRRVLSELRSIDVAKELPRWRLAEKIFTERSLPWSRLTAELERNLAVDVRLKSIQRTRSSDMKVQLKLKGEARSRKAEAAFVTALHENPFFEQVFLEQESERQGGGVDFDYTLAVRSVPPPYVPLPKQPKYGPAPSQAGKQTGKLPAKPAPPVPAPVRALPPVPVKPGIRTQPVPVLGLGPSRGGPPVLRNGPAEPPSPQALPPDPSGRPTRRGPDPMDGRRAPADPRPSPREGRS